MKFARGPVVLVFMGLLAVSLAAQDMPPAASIISTTSNTIAPARKAAQSRSNAIGPQPIAQTALPRNVPQWRARDPAGLWKSFLRQKGEPEPQVEKKFSDEIQKAGSRERAPGQNQRHGRARGVAFGLRANYTFRCGKPGAIRCVMPPPLVRTPIASQRSIPPIMMRG